MLLWEVCGRISASAGRIVLGISASTGGIARGPSNAVVVSGARAMFSCETREATSTGLCWQRRGVNERTLCNSNGCNARYSVDTSIYPRHSFMIDSVIATDSGRYSCAVCKNPRTERTAHLIVIGRSATVLFECSVRDVRFAYTTVGRLTGFLFNLGWDDWPAIA